MAKLPKGEGQVKDDEVGQPDDDPVVVEPVVVESVETVDVLADVVESVFVDEEDSLVDDDESAVELVNSVVDSVDESGTDTVDEPVVVTEVVDVGPVPIVAVKFWIRK